MCGRYTFTLSAASLTEAFGLVPPGFAIRDGYNIGPGQYIVIVRPEGGHRVADVAYWGLIPSWVEDPKTFSKPFNARAETLTERPTFRAAFRRKRVIIPVSGFYEWHEQEGGDQPFYIHPVEGEFFALAGLMEDRPSPNGELMISACIITTTPNKLLAKIHNKKPRMPAILPRASWDLWLDPASQTREIQPLLVPYPDVLMAAHPVSRAVGDVRNKSPDLILPVA
jgi:putative SOS response-associated peptidase YedK